MYQEKNQFNNQSQMMGQPIYQGQPQMMNQPNYQGQPQMMNQPNYQGQPQMMNQPNYQIPNQNYQIPNQAVANNMYARPMLNYASTGSRIGAYLLDSLIPFGVSILLFIIILVINLIIVANNGAVSPFLTFIQYCLTIIITFCGIFFYRGLTDAKGSSIGRKATKTIVVHEDGSPITTGQSFLRQFVKSLLDGTGVIPLINVILLFTDAKKQTLVDKIMKTVVIYK